ncbi:tetratricopeptide repeat protein [Methylobacterium sp. WL30]|uniref:tetratricopeptide repeat protein n=1 Tax=unclassified Methylobacterium TaxID=2615210 RepID=UPI0011C8874B|nr:MULTISPECIES: tetratricopeptide repeat protein [unclassified Methylobacterium]TXN39017.1 tetratricopeptide repeat protein [Methylobacterium sp. WL93]TXN50194.1 tetratricopeptide repeat protein [Methylobacterium sp. WL119]TXN67389.1 tetratricopeptide repeat protein [Methylobacterium sp. WL30]
MARRTNHRDLPVASQRRSSTARLLKDASLEQRAGRLAAAERQYRRVLDADPQNAEANYKLGIIASQTDRVALAVPHFAAALKAGPDQPHYWLSLATALLGARRVGDARSVLERFREKRFADAETQATLTALIANLFTEAHQHYEDRLFKDAEPLIDMIVMLDEGHVEALHMAGSIAAQTNRLTLAVDLLQIAVSLDDDAPVIKGNLGTILARQGRYGEANACFDRSIEIDPNNPNTFSNFGVALRKQGRLRDAIDRFDEALRLCPDFAQAHSNRGSALMDMGLLDEAIAAYDEALRIDPSLSFVHSNRLFTKLYSADYTAEERFADAQAFGLRFADPLLRRRPFANDRDPERRLRVGFVSGDFREHAVNYFFEPALHRFDTTQIETFAFSNTVNEDAATERLKASFAHWHCLCGLTDDEAADLIEAEAIDILVDLSGHTAENRILVFARKPAPIQVGWIGYPGTTGMAAIDYRFTDIFIEPDGTGDDVSVETLWRLPHVVACYQAPAADLPLSGRPPSEDAGYITFGCVNRYTKVSDPALVAWRDILLRVPGSRLLLEIADVDDPDVGAQVRARLQRLGLPLDRVILIHRSPSNRYVLYNRIDIALDPFPYNGGTTSFDALWMGVPFIALEGEHVVSRMGCSALAILGLPELSGRSTAAYIDIAATLALDPDRLRAVRRDLRGRLARSPHMSHATLAADVEGAFRQMWRRWAAPQERHSG